MRSRIPTLTYDFKLATFHAERGQYNEAKDCSVRALAVILGDSYRDAHEILRIGGRKNRQGFYLDWFLSQKSTIAGLKITEVAFNPAHKMTPSIFAHTYKKGKYIVTIHRHAFAVIDGIIFDAGRVKPHTRVFGAWRFE